MSEPTLQVQIDAASAYEALMVPALFAPWASKVADAARLRQGQRVLDLACGTGVLAREASARTMRSGAVTGLDANPGMLAVARRLAPGLDWRKGVAESLPFADRSFDAVVSQFGLMFFADQLQALREALRVLVPGGSLTLAVWDALDNNPAYAAVVAVLQCLAGQRAADALRAPFVLGRRDALVAMLRDAGAASFDVTTDRSTARFPSARIMVEADLRGWLPLMGAVLPEEQIAQTLREAEQVLSPYVQPDGTIAFETSAHIATAERPDVLSAGS